MPTVRNTATKNSIKLHTGLLDLRLSRRHLGDRDAEGRAADVVDVVGGEEANGLGVPAVPPARSNLQDRRVAEL